MLRMLLIVLFMLSMFGCSSVTTSDKAFMSHAESFNLLFFRIPGGDTRERALAQVPKGGKIKSMVSTPADTGSLLGVLNRILGVDYTHISGTL